MAALKMKKAYSIKLLIAFTGLLFLLTACATVPKGPPFETVQSTPKDDGILYIYDHNRGPRLSSVNISEVLINDNVVGKLYRRDYLAFQVKPGPVKVSTGWGTKLNDVKVDIEPSNQYYVRVNSHPMFFSMTDKWVIRPELVAEQKAMEEIKDCFYTEPGKGLADELMGKSTPGTDWSKIKKIYIDMGKKKWKAAPFLAEGFRKRGFVVKTGMADGMPEDTEALVRVNEHWFWDLGTYLLALEVEIMNPQTGDFYASAKVRRAWPQGRRGPEIMSNEVLNAIFNDGMPEGVEPAIGEIRRK